MLAMQNVRNGVEPHHGKIGWKADVSETYPFTDANAVQLAIVKAKNTTSQTISLFCSTVENAPHLGSGKNAK